jgi:type II pantothenate kinase
MLRLAERGDNTKVDMLVGDIYGTDYNRIGLKSTTIASTMGKVFRTKRRAEREAEDHGGMGLHLEENEDHAATPTAASSLSHASNSDNNTSTEATNNTPTSANSSSSTTNPSSATLPAASHHISFRPEDLSRSLLYAISNNIGQLAYLHAEKHGCEHVYFGGSFIGGHWQTMATLSYAIKFWSKGTKEAYFLRHEGYLGAVGAFLNRQPVNWGIGKKGRANSFDGLLALSRVGTREAVVAEREKERGDGG